MHSLHPLSRDRLDSMFGVEKCVTEKLHEPKDLTKHTMSTFDNDESFTTKYELRDAGAVAPNKKRRSDAGYDLTLIKKLKTDEYGTEWYDSGTAVEPPSGYYYDLVGRSSLIKKGRQLANCIGIIDETYRGNIMVALTKLTPAAPELELPNRACQLILRKCHDHDMERVDLVSTTDRGHGGFGSSGL